MQPPAPALVLMSRAPVAGRTKTRLTPPFTPEDACALHAACLNDLLAEGVRWQRAALAAGRPEPALHLFITPPASQPAFRAAGVRIPTPYALHNQRGEGLGERMAHAVRAAQQGGPRPVVLVGTDLPLLGAAQLDAALQALEAADVVFGPTPDGGYYLVALRGDPAGVFDVQGWGGATVLERSRAALQAAGRRTALIESLPDADTAADLAAIARHPLAGTLAGRQSVQRIRHMLASTGETLPS